MITFSILFTIAAGLIMLAVIDRLWLRDHRQKNGKITTSHKVCDISSRYFSALCIIGAMVLVIIAVWVTH
ncbi:MAG: hypothetical protein A3F17_06760 [Gammaproteobacteria bacterium RIFCSPHIGHO2_12_FULL_41_15]|nr:MAG: hypothetical protein A3F17_06760 [Gammaproteobacteria bacterium RIFCSPHIGHO2_12_FULL_41_15]